MSDKSNNVVENFSKKFTSWYNILIFLILIGSGIGNYMVSNYRHDQHEKEIANLQKKIEKINYELVMTQLNDIQEVNKKLNKQLEGTNGRIDKVLEILSSK